jgi:hypothetical protein
MAERQPAAAVRPDNNTTEVGLPGYGGTAEDLPAAYWRYLRRRSGGLIRGVGIDRGPETVLLFKPLVLLRFGPPRIERAGGLERVTMTIEGGLLLARSGRGHGALRFELERPPGAPAPVIARGIVEGYLPRLRGPGPLLGLRSWIYSQTQLRLHFRVTSGFLRSLGA